LAGGRACARATRLPRVAKHCGQAEIQNANKKNPENPENPACPVAPEDGTGV